MEVSWIWNSGPQTAPGISSWQVIRSQGGWSVLCLPAYFCFCFSLPLSLPLFPFLSLSLGLCLYFSLSICCTFSSQVDFFHFLCTWWNTIIFIASKCMDLISRPTESNLVPERLLVPDSRDTESHWPSLDHVSNPLQSESTMKTRGVVGGQPPSKVCYNQDHSSTTR